MSRSDDGSLGGFVTRPSRVGISHSCTPQESKTLMQISVHNLFERIDQKELIDYTKEIGTTALYKPVRYSNTVPMIQAAINWIWSDLCGSLISPSSPWYMIPF